MNLILKSLVIASFVSTTVFGSAIITNNPSLSSRPREGILSISLDPLDSTVCPFRPVKGSEQECRMDQEQLETLISVQILFRHGMRTPVKTYPNDPYKNDDLWTQGAGQLTGQGKHWSYRLGEFIRCRYDGYLDKKYSFTEVYCKTSEMDRTMMTAYSVLAALYPPTPSDLNSHVNFPRLDWQPIPCTTIPSELDNKINQEARTCPMYSKYLTQHIDNFTSTMNNETAELFREVSISSGMDIKDFNDISILYDTISIEHCVFGLPYPKWFPELALKMKPFHDSYFYKVVATEEMKRLYAGAFLEEIVQNFDARLLNGSSTIHPSKMYLYSGHDSTISSVLYTLGVYDVNNVPPFNAAVFFELHRNPELALGNFSASNVFIKLFYRPEPGTQPQELVIPGCSPCTYDLFKSLTSKYRLDDTTWEKECGLPTRMSIG